MDRRSFLQSILAAGVAPYVMSGGVAAGILMPVRQIWTPQTISDLLDAHSATIGGGYDLPISLPTPWHFIAISLSTGSLTKFYIDAIEVPSLHSVDASVVSLLRDMVKANADQAMAYTVTCRTNNKFVDEIQLITE